MATKKYAVLFVIALVALSGLIIVSQVLTGYRQGLRAKWNSMPQLVVPSSVPDFFTTVSIEGQTSTEWSVIVELSSGYGGSGAPLEGTVDKKPTLGGFCLCDITSVGSAFWLFWIDPTNVTETTGFNLPGDLLIVYPFDGSTFVLAGPFTFAVEEGLMIHTDGSYRMIWVFTDGGSEVVLIYDGISGLLLDLTYEYDLIAEVNSINTVLLEDNF